MTTSLVFLLVAAGALVFYARRDNGKLRAALSKKPLGFGLLPKAITLLVITAQTSELVKVLEHVSPVQLVATLFLLTIVVALKSGTESEIY